jgi:hypothetical protein
MRVAGLLSILGLVAGLALPATPVDAAATAPAADRQSPGIIQFTHAEDARVCGVQTQAQEHAQAIPDRLLHAISLVESGRWDSDRRASFAWPWTVTAEGEGHFLPSKAAAIAEVSRLKAKGVTNIDVGCMQVNLQAHPDAFANLDQAFDPAANVAYGARFLVDLRAGTPDWETAAAYYHSQTPALAASYKTKLVAAWNAARGRADDRATATASTEFDIRPPVGMVLPTPAQGAQSPAQLLAEVTEAAKAAAAETQAERAVRLARTEAEKAEAKRIAQAYRSARMAEYRARKLQTAAANG